MNHIRHPFTQWIHNSYTCILKEHTCVTFTSYMYNFGESLETLINVHEIEGVILTQQYLVNLYGSISSNIL